MLGGCHFLVDGCRIVVGGVGFWFVDAIFCVPGFVFWQFFCFYLWVLVSGWRDSVLLGGLVFFLIGIILCLVGLFSG